MPNTERPLFHDHMTAEEISAALDAWEALQCPKRDAITGQLQAAYQEYPDSRTGIAAHPAVCFDLQLPPGQSVAAFLQEQLGAADVQQLKEDWAARGVNLDYDAPLRSQAILFLDSNSKARNRQYAPRGAQTTQEEDFKSAALEGFANDVQMTLICAALVKKARDAGIDLTKNSEDWDVAATGKLKPEELDLLAKLRDGLVRTSSGALGVDDDGRLRAFFYYAGGVPGYWAAGAAPAAE